MIAMVQAWKPAFLFALCCFLASPAPLQTQSIPLPPVTPLIDLDVVVTAKSGAPALGLGRENFTVLDNGAPRPILHFQSFSGGPSASEPEQAIFILDGINTDIRDMARARAALASFLRRDGGRLKLPVSLLLLTQRSAGFLGERFLDGSALAGNLDGAPSRLRLLRDAGGAEGDVERDGLSLRDLLALAREEEPKPGRKLVIWVGPGWPYVIGPNIHYGQAELQANFRTIATLSTALREARIELSSVDPRGAEATNSYEATYYKGVRKGIRRESDAQIETLGLQVLASQSGGLVLDSSNDLEREFAACLRDAEAWYSFSVAAEPPNPGEDRRETYHQLTIQAARPSGGERLTARTRAGYYRLP